MMDRTRPFNPPDVNVWSALLHGFGIDLYRGGVVKFHGIEITKAMVETLQKLTQETVVKPTPEPISEEVPVSEPETITVEVVHGDLMEGYAEIEVPRTKRPYNKKGQ